MIYARGPRRPRDRATLVLALHPGIGKEVWVAISPGGLSRSLVDLAIDLEKRSWVFD